MPAATDTLPATADQLVAELAAIRAELEPIEARRTELYARRLALFQAGRELTPPITQAALGAAAGITEVGVGSQLRKLRPADGAGAPA